MSADPYWEPSFVTWTDSIDPLNKGWSFALKSWPVAVATPMSPVRDTVIGS